MRERLQGVWTTIREKWNGLERSQKIQVMAIAVVFLLVLGATIYLNTRVNWVLLIDNKDVTTISTMQNALEDAGIPNRMARGGRGLEVDNKMTLQAKKVLADNGLTKDASGKYFTFEQAIASSGMGTTESTKKQMDLRVKQSDLANDLRVFDGIEDASVTLIVPERNYFFEKPEDKSSVAVILTTSRTLDAKEAQAVALFVLASVEGLELSGIEIMDQRYNVIYSGSREQNGTMANQYDTEKLYKTEMEMKLKVALAPLFDDVKPTANLVFNWDRVQQRSTKHETPIAGSTTGAPVKQITEESKVTGGTAAAEPGAGSNDQATPSYQTGNQSSSSASKKSSEMELIYDTTETMTENAAGALDTAKSSIGVILYRYITYDQDYMTRNNLLNGQTWDAFRAANQAEKPITIDNNIIDLIKMSTGIENLSVSGYEVAMFVDKPVKPVDVKQITVYAILALMILILAFGVISRTKPVTVTELEPEVPLEELLESTIIDEQKQDEVSKLEAIADVKDSEVKRQIEKFINEKPEAAAQLLRNWIREEWE